MKKLTFKSFLPLPNHRVLSCLLLGLTLSSGVLLVVISATNMLDDDKPNEVMSQLDALQNKMSTLQDSMNKPAPEINLSSMTQQIQQLSQQLDVVRAQNSHHLDQALNQTETVLINRLDAIQQMVRHLDEKPQAIKYLPIQSLPFSVVSLDSIQHVPVASVAYDFKNVAIEKGDSLAGWQVLSIDYVMQRIEFENGKKERVLITHEHIGSGEL